MARRAGMSHDGLPTISRQLSSTQQLPRSQEIPRSARGMRRLGAAGLTSTTSRLGGGGSGHAPRPAATSRLGGGASGHARRPAAAGKALRSAEASRKLEVSQRAFRIRGIRRRLSIIMHRRHGGRGCGVGRRGGIGAETTQVSGMMSDTSGQSVTFRLREREFMMRLREQSRFAITLNGVLTEKRFVPAGPAGRIYPVSLLVRRGSQR
jgi:hypothetical protein